MTRASFCLVPPPEPLAFLSRDVTSTPRPVLRLPSVPLPSIRDGRNESQMERGRIPNRPERSAKSLMEAQPKRPREKVRSAFPLNALGIGASSRETRGVADVPVTPQSRKFVRHLP